MSSSIQYNPNPPRVWSRVQNPCSVIAYKNDDPGANSDFARADYERQMLLKGNILQYKKNSSNLTKKQRYTQIAKGMWTNRTKTWATQSDTYSNPNMTSLLRVNSSVLDPSNNTFSSRSNPFGCPTTEIQDGGNLVCNVVVDPCTQEVVKRTKSQQLCNPTTDSDVPGQIQYLCWNDGTQTWYPRQRYIMPTSGSKWPQGYKGFVSAVTFVGPVLSIETMTCGQLSIPLSWTFLDSTCIPITSFNIYQDEVLILNVPVSQTSVTIQGNPEGTYNFYVTSLSNDIESEKSNNVFVNTQIGITINGTASYTYTNNIVTFTFNQSSIITFNCPIASIYILCIGGGGGGGGAGNNYGSGGGSGGIGVVNTSIIAGNIFNITVGVKGPGAKDQQKGNPGTSSSVYNGINNVITSTGGGGGNTSGGTAGISSSIYAVTSYNGGAGGIYQLENGFSLNISPISMLTNFLYGGGGGGGGFNGGGQSGNLSIGGLKNTLQPNFNGGSANSLSYGSGGGGGGNNSGDYYNGGSGANGVVIIQFTYP
jgi:hypothetical protein